MRSGRLDESQLEHHLHNRGFLARVLGRVTRRVSRPWHLYPVGLLMGLGFDTATQVGLLVLIAGSAAFVLPWYAIVVLPVLFMAGMSLFDTADGVLMTRAYGWAMVKPVRKVFYNLTITVLSVVVALVVGTMVLVGLLVDRFGIEGGPLAWIASLDLDHVGFAVVGLFVVTWAVAVAVWRYGRIEERWQTDGIRLGLTDPAPVPRLSRRVPRRRHGARRGPGRRPPPPARPASPGCPARAARTPRCRPWRCRRAW